MEVLGNKFFFEVFYGRKFNVVFNYILGGWCVRECIFVKV